MGDVLVDGAPLSPSSNAPAPPDVSQAGAQIRRQPTRPRRGGSGVRYAGRPAVLVLNKRGEASSAPGYAQVCGT
jgi:hypothetical protein